MPIERFYSLTEIVLCGRIVSLGADGRVLLIPKMGVLYLILRAVHIVLETFIQVVYIEYGARSSRVILRPVLVKFAIHGSYAPSFAIRIAVHPFVATLVLIAQTEEKSFIVAGFPFGSGVLYHHYGFRIIAVFAYPRQMIAYVIRVINVAVQRLDADSGVVEAPRQPFDADLRAHEHDRLLGPLGLDHPRERVGLLAVG